MTDFFHLSHIFKVHLYILYQYFIPFDGQIIFCCMFIHILFFHLSVDGHFGLFCLLAFRNNTAVNIYVQVFCVDMFSVLLAYMP